MKFTIEFKRGPETIAMIEGLEVDPEIIKASDLLEVVRVEQRLEIWTGFRVHIFAIVNEKNPDPWGK